MGMHNVKGLTTVSSHRKVSGHAAKGGVARAITLSVTAVLILIGVTRKIKNMGGVKRNYAQSRGGASLHKLCCLATNLK